MKQGSLKNARWREWSSEQAIVAECQVSGVRSCFNIYQALGYSSSFPTRMKPTLRVQQQQRHTGSLLHPHSPTPPTNQPARLIRRLNSQLEEEEVLLFGLEDVNQLQDVGVLHPKRVMRHGGKEEKRQREGCQESFTSRIV